MRRHSNFQNRGKHPRGGSYINNNNINNLVSQTSNINVVTYGNYNTIIITPIYISYINNSVR